MLSEGDEFAGHRIEAVAGRGGMGVVYRAVQLGLDRVVALKLIAPGLAGDEDFRARFVRESRAAAAIEHPNVLPLYAAGEADGELYLSMRFVEGHDLRTLVRAGGPLEPARAAAIVGQVAAALDAAHARGLVHRDVKPANVLLDQNMHGGPARGAMWPASPPLDHAYLTDFGLTKSFGDATAGPSAPGFVGTLGFVAPEQIRGERLDARADVYALGCVLFYLVRGQAPYVRERDEALMYAHLNDPVPQLSGALEPFDAVIARAMAKDPEERYPSAGDLGRAVLAAAGTPVAERQERSVATGAAAPGEVTDAPTVVAGTGSARGETRTTAPEPGGTKVALGPFRSTGGTARRRWFALAALVVLGAAVVVVFVLAGGGGSKDESTRTTPVRSTAPHPGPLLHVGARPNSLTVAGGTVWVTGSSSTKLVRLRASDGSRLPGVTIPKRATDVDASGSTLWLTNLSEGTVTRFDLRTGRQKGSPTPVPGAPVVVSVQGDAVWIGSRTGSVNRTSTQSVVRLSASTGAMARVVAIPGGVQDLAVGLGAVWVTNRDTDTFTRIDVHTGRLTRRRVGADPRGISVGGGAVWIALNGEDNVARVDPTTLKSVTTHVGHQPQGIAAASDAVWVADYADDDVRRLDPRTGRQVGAPVQVGRNPKTLYIDGHSLWLTAIGDDAVERVTF